MSNEKDLVIPNEFDLGLDDGEVNSPSTSPVEDKSIKKAKDAINKAAATAALEAAVKSSGEVSRMEAERAYIQEKKRFMLNKCKNDEQVPFVGQKIFANYFGPVYTFLYNTVPVTVKFDGTTQMFPRFIYDFLIAKITEVSESNTNKDETIQM